MGCKASKPQKYAVPQPKKSKSSIHNSNHLMKLSENQFNEINFEVLYGDLNQGKYDAIVNFVGKKVEQEKANPKIIGDKLLSEVQEVTKKSKLEETDRVYVTEVQNTNTKNAINVWVVDQSTDGIEESVATILNKAEKIGAQTIVFPEFDPGFMKLNRNLYVSSILNSALKFVKKKNQESSLKTICFANKDEKEGQELQHELELKIKENQATPKKKILEKSASFKEYFTPPRSKLQVPSIGQSAFFEENQTQMTDFDGKERIRSIKFMAPEGSKFKITDIKQGHHVKKMFIVDHKDWIISKKFGLTYKFNHCKVISAISSAKSLVHGSWENLFIELSPQRAGLLKKILKLFRNKSYSHAKLDFLQANKYPSIQPLMKSYLRHLQRVKNLRHFELNSDLMRGDIIYPIQKCMKSFEQVQSIRLFFNSPHCNDVYFTSIFQGLRQLPHLETFHIRILYYNFQGVQWMPTLKNSLQQIKGFQRLFMDLELSVEPETFKEIIDNIQLFSGFPLLGLGFQFFGYLDQLDFMYIYMPLLIVKNIYYLGLQFIQSNISDSNLKQLTMLLRQLPKLEGFKLQVNDCEEISNVGLNECMKSLSKLSQLDILDIDIDKDQSIDKPFYLLLMQFLSSIQPSNLRLKLKDVREIPLDAYNQSYQNSLQKFKNLKVLNLDYFNSLCDNTQLFDLAKVLRDNKRIQELTLNFQQCKNFNDTGIIHFFQHLSTTLRVININFSQCYSITDESLKAFSQRIVCLDHLEDLCLKFNYCDLISPAGIAEMSMALPALDTLTSLQLEFRKCYFIEDNALFQLATGIAMLKNSLVNLELDLSYCSNLTLDSIDLLSEALELLVNLSHCELRFYSCSQISLYSKNRLTRALKNLPRMFKCMIAF